MTGAPKLTDRKALALHRARAEARPEPFLHQAIADALQERLAEVKKSFRAPLLIGHALAPIRAILPASFMSRRAFC